MFRHREKMCIQGLVENFKLALHQTRITLAAKNRQGIYQNRQGNHPWRLAAKQNAPRIEGQGNMIYLAASRQGYFSWRFGRQARRTNGKIFAAPRKYCNRQGYNFHGGCRPPNKLHSLAG